MNMKLSALAIATALFSTSVLAAPLTLQTYNPQENAIFAVNSTLASGPHEAVLFDAQFSVKDGEKLVEMVQKSGKKLTRIVITSGDLRSMVRRFICSGIFGLPQSRPWLKLQSVVAIIPATPASRARCTRSAI